MTINVLYAANPKRWTTYEPLLRAAFAEQGLDFNLSDEMPPEEVDYIVYASNSTLKDFAPYTRLKAVMNLWAGVEGIIGNDTLRVPLTRMVDDGLTQGMREWVVGYTLRHHLEMDRFLQDGEWRLVNIPLAQDRPVTILGLGALGLDCAQHLAHLGFDVTGWSRSQKSVPGITCLSGEDGLRKALATAQILVLLLPLTPETDTLINAERLAQLPAGAVLLNPGRGPLIDDDALLAALDSGHIGHATLDVFRAEPLDPAHPYWAHPRVTVTPHVASDTRPPTASKVVAENLRRAVAGEPLLHLVDRSRGY